MLAVTADLGSSSRRSRVAARPLGVLREGDLVDGRYVVEEQLGEGGMGIVFAARHVELGHRVAIKVLRPEACGRADLVARFRWEARAGLQIRSEHVVRVTDAGTLDGGVPYMVMELLDGIDLAALLSRRGTPLDVEDAVDFVLQACEALAEAHALGIVHRDLKPENLFLTRRADGSHLVKLIDFGISSGVELTIGGGEAGGEPAVKVEIMGSPGYMSPEQVRNFDDVDARADVWSLGAILYELLTGWRVHDDASIGVVLARTCYCPAPAARTLRADLPDELDGVIARCLEREVDLRIQSVADLARSLLPFAAERSRLSVARVVAIAAATLT